MRVLLLGGTGFLGHHLVDELKLMGYSTVSASSSHRADVVVDLSIIGAVKDVIDAAQAQVVINLAGTGLPSSRSKVTDQVMWRINTRLPSEVYRVLVQARKEVHFLHVASALEAVPDESTYALTKRRGSERLSFLMEQGLGSDVRANILAMHNLYGPRQPTERFVSDTIRCAREGRRILIHHPHRARDFVYVQDAVEAIVSIIQAPPTAPKTQIVGTGRKTPVVEVAYRILELMGADPNLIGVKERPPSIAEPEADEYFRGFEQYLCKTSLEEGLLQTMKHL